VQGVTRWRAALVLTSLLALGLPAQEGGGAAGHRDPGHAQKSTMEMTNEEFFIGPFSHLVPRAEFHPQVSADEAVNRWFVFYNVNKFQVIVLLLMLVLFVLVLSSFRQSRPPWLLRVFRGWVHWLRDEMVYAVMGKEGGAPFVPYFTYLFFFIAFCNLIGLIPGSVTATATLFVTGALALVTAVMIIGGGMLKQGPIAFWKHLLPPGLPIGLIPLMAVVEFIGLFVKPFALMVRLFANMLGGHLVLYSFVAMIFLFAKMMSMGVFAWATAIPSFAMAVFINVLEAFVALLQAYIFTYLSVIFVQQGLHPEH
jgi:F-type H+-transporting ATPase subunit a